MIMSTGMIEIADIPASAISRIDSKFALQNEEKSTFWVHSVGLLTFELAVVCDMFFILGG